MEKICVAVRFRPPLPQEGLNPSPSPANWRIDDNRISLHSPLGTPISGVSFAFDHVFDDTCTNLSVYERHTKDVIQAAVKGFNGTVFAYGQTSSGKTFTMKGSSNDPGVIHLAVQDVFRNIKLTTDREFLIRVSYMEIYNEEINDLFRPENRKLQIHENLERGIFVAGLREEIVNSPEQVIDLIEYGEVHRHVGQTNINSRSSRSHTIFRMVIESRGQEPAAFGDRTEDAVRVSVLNLVDLAGSERIAKTGAGGVRLKEGKYINKSLMALGNVINKLSDNGVRQRGHIPYRDSKLTRILQPALGGNAKTSIICTVAPEEVHVDETRGTLQFASRAKRITNCVQVNEILTDAALLKRQKMEIEELRRKLKGSHSGVLELEILKLRNEMLKSEQEREKLAMELEKERKSREQRDSSFEEQQLKPFDDIPQPGQERCSDMAPEICLSAEAYDRSNGTPSIDNSRTPRTPYHGDVSKVLVAKRFHEAALPECSPVPDDFANVADEDMWMRLNKGHSTIDLDLLHFTPDVKHFSISSRGAIQVQSSIEHHKDEMNALRLQLETALNSKTELEKNLENQLSLNEQLMLEVSKLQHEALLVREYPQKIWDAVAELKDIYTNISSHAEVLTSEQKHSNVKFLSSTCDMGVSLFEALANHLLLMTKNEGAYPGLSIQEEFKILSEKISQVAALAKASNIVDTSKEDLLQNCKILREHTFMEKTNGCLCESKDQLLESVQERCCNLEEECNSMKEERASLVHALSISTQNLALLNSQKEEMRKELKELRRRKTIDEKLRQFGMAFIERHSLFASLRDDVQAKSQCLQDLFC
ncbi:kinesin-like protein KIN-7L isoform X1 [Nymphaea colorata]|nr:kinesin-like protein KIN-7L isoform X1 [Nymphaea colorata]